MGAGSTLIVIAVAHLLVGLVLYAGELAGIVADGVFASVPDFGDRAAAFWFLISAVPVLLLGLCVRQLERAGQPLARALVAGLLVLALLIVIPMPASGGWAFFVAAWLAWRRAQFAHDNKATESSLPRE